MLKIRLTPSYNEDIERLEAVTVDLSPLDYVIGFLAKGKPLNKQYNDHALHTRYAGMRECHIEDDWLLIYRIEKNVLQLVATGTHAELFYE